RPLVARGSGADAGSDPDRLRFVRVRWGRLWDGTARLVLGGALGAARPHEPAHVTAQWGGGFWGPPGSATRPRAPCSPTPPGGRSWLLVRSASFRPRPRRAHRDRVG